mgnify:FL=1
MYYANYHTHTCFCDGRDTPEQLVQEAIRLGCPALGFSGHSYTPYEAAWMPKERILPYQAEIRRLQAVYSGQIRILLGIEQDYYSDEATDAYEYVIGAVHNLRRGGEYRPLDYTRDRLIATVNDWFGGDWYALAEEYYALVGDLYEKTHCRVIAHFDLIEKFNETCDLFDRTHPRYRAAALAALDRLKDAPVIFEVNTGAIARGYRTTPYPDPFLLQAMQDAGVRLMLNSDCHDRRFLLCGFDQYAHLVPKESFSPDYLLNA